MMKKTVLFLLISATVLSCAPGSFDIPGLIRYRISNMDKTGTLTAKVNNTPISLEELRKEMKFSLGFEYSDKDVDRLMADPAIQSGYEQKLINQYLIMTEMINDKTLQDAEFDQYLWIQMKEAMVKYYLYRKFFAVPENARWKDLLVTTDTEVMDFYSENKKFFDDRGVSEADALNAIRNDLTSRKNQSFLYELTTFQSKLINDLKVRYKVEMNP
jgi:hypothetical protein